MSRDYQVQEQHSDLQAFSFSRLSCFNHCEYEYYLTYIKQFPRSDNIYGLVGNKTHNLCEKLQKQEITNEKALKEFLNYIEELKMFGINFPNEKIEKNFVECLTHFFKHYKPIKCDKYEIEKGFDILVGETKTLLLGFIDLMIILNDNEVEIYDYKTSSKFSKSDLKEKQMQLLAYALGCINQYNLNPVRLGFNMLKYAEIEWIENNNKKSTISKRNNIGFKLKTPATRMLKKMGYDDVDIDMIVQQMEETNIIPDILKNKFKIKDYYIYIEPTQEKIKEFEKYVDKTINKINTKKKAEDYKPVYITDKTSFYCATLCGQRQNCKYYKYYLDGNLSTLKQNPSDDLDADLF